MAAWQSGITSAADQGKICSFDYEVIEEKTKALMHQAARFLYFKQGKGILSVDGVQYKIVPNTLIAITPYEITDMIQVVETMQFIKIIYDYACINSTMKATFGPGTDIAELLRLLSSQPAVYLDEEQALQVDRLMEDFRNELGVESTLAFPPRRELTSLYTVNKIMELMILYARFFTANNSISLEMEKDSDAVSKAQGLSILGYMYAHSDETLSLEKLSKVFFISESSAAKYINEQTGSTFTAVIEGIRIEKVTDYLIHTDMTLEDIASLTGFADASHLTKRFIEQTGIKPAEYRRIYRKANPTFGKTDKELAYRVTDYIYNHFATEKFKQEAVAEHFGISVNELNRSLLYYTGKSFENLLNFIRINKAAEKLISTDETIMDVAIDTGYSNVKTFNLNFFKYRNMTPTDFRRKITLQKSDGSEEQSGTGK